MLEPHHKVRLWKLLSDYPGDRNNPFWLNDPYFYDINNGITLCKICHRKTYRRDNDDELLNNGANSVEVQKLDNTEPAGEIAKGSPGE